MTKMRIHGHFTPAAAWGWKGGARKLISSAVVSTVLSLCATARAQTFTTLVNFDGADGANPYSVGLVQGFDGNLYGTTQRGGANGLGTVFKITPLGTLTTLYSFCTQANCADGAYPIAGLVPATDGDLYGTTYGGSGTTGFGTVFKVTPTGTLTTLYNFCAQQDCNDGSHPAAPLIQGADGDFYGTTELGGIKNGGTVFKITPAGTLTTLHSFCAQTGCADGRKPVGGLVLGTDGNFYGTTEYGGNSLVGTVFEITRSGTLTTLHSFISGEFDGGLPQGALVQAQNGNFYGTTGQGGLASAGTVFTMTPSGVLTILHSFCTQLNCSDGSGPVAGLLLATDGNLYGTTYQGGFNSNDGTAFQITSSGTLTTLHTFDGTDGANPFGALVQATNGNFYATTYRQGASGDGSAFSLSMGLAPFVETLPTTGRVGTTVTILGNDLTGTTSVTFNGTPSTFKVVGGSEIKTTVPAGATSGTVEVTTPTGTLQSNVSFVVR